jgi:uncharacterized radical SAM protein YgiQ
MQKRPDLKRWLPTTKKEVELREWDRLDVIIISGDAYVDHPSFGHAVMARFMENLGLKVAIIPQPNWRDDLRDFKKLGEPKLFFGVTAGCMDSMVNHYTANKRLRSNDAYTSGGESGFRPDYPTIAYTKILKKLFPETPVIIGGIEASLRRVTHYDYWSNSLRSPILIDSGADLLVYGMGEQPIKEIVTLLKKGVPFSSLKTVPQTAFVQQENDPLPKVGKWDTIELASHDKCLTSKAAYATNFAVIEKESNKKSAKRLTQRVGNQSVVINPHFPTMTEKEIDTSYDLPFTRLPHPKYAGRGDIPAYEMIKFSINIHRGCFGGCSFCTISAHQGKFIASRSKKSILKELEEVTALPDFKGYISDIGGPSANMYQMKGNDDAICGICAKSSCIFPKKCKILDASHKPLLDLYHEAAAHPKVKKAFIGSGIRYDILLNAKDKKEHETNMEYIKQVAEHHVSGRLKVAPEHTSDKVLKLMRKPSFKLFREFKKIFDSHCDKLDLNQQVVPYFISSHPGCEIKDMAELAIEAKRIGINMEKVQDFTPTPMTLATVIYYSGINPYTNEAIYTAKSKDEKLDQRRFFFWNKPENRNLIRKSLKKYFPAGLKLFDR